jgi:hypothetical protein
LIKVGFRQLAGAATDDRSHRVRRIQVDQMADTVQSTVGNAYDHHAAITVADQNNILAVLALSQVDDIGDVGFEIDGGSKEMLSNRNLSAPGDDHEFRFGHRLTNFPDRLVLIRIVERASRFHRWKFNNHNSPVKMLSFKRLDGATSGQKAAAMRSDDTGGERFVLRVYFRIVDDYLTYQIC